MKSKIKIKTTIDSKNSKNEVGSMSVF